ncbi:MAG: hypothetical protein JXQ97_05630 [Natronospirillum sp.]
MSTLTQRFMRALPGVIYAAIMALGITMVIDGVSGREWLLCQLSNGLCVGDFGVAGTILRLLYSVVGLAVTILSVFTLYRYLRLGGARQQRNEADRLLLQRAIVEIRTLYRQRQYARALMLIESLRKKYPGNAQLRELEVLLTRELDVQEMQQR